MREKQDMKYWNEMAKSERAQALRLDSEWNGKRSSNMANYATTSLMKYGLPGNHREKRVTSGRRSGVGNRNYYSLFPRLQKLHIVTSGTINSGESS